MTARTSRTAAYRLYLTVMFVIAATLAMIFTTVIVYRVEDVGLNPFQLVLVGTVLEAAYCACQLPTAFVADRVSRRLSAIIGILVLGGALLMEGLLPLFAGIAAAQVVRALGHAFLSGALESWVADELGEHGIAQVYVRGTQAGQVGRLVGVLLSAVVASIALNLPLLIGGAVLLVLGGALVLVMPENNFQPDGADEAEDPEGDGKWSLRSAVRTGKGYVATMGKMVWASPFLIALFAAVAFLGTWSESFDRLWGALFLEEFTFPSFGGFEPVVWFSAMTFVATLLRLAISDVVRRRIKAVTKTAESAEGPADASRVGVPPGAVEAVTRRMLLILIVVTAVVLAATAVFGLTGSFVVAVLAYWAVTALRPAYDPLITALTVTHVRKNMRATMLSAREMCDAGGQFSGGPTVGGIGTLFGLRASLVTAAALLLPVCGLLALLLRSPAQRRRRKAALPNESDRATGPAPDGQPPLPATSDGQPPT